MFLTNQYQIAYSDAGVDPIDFPSAPAVAPTGHAYVYVQHMEGAGYVRTGCALNTAEAWRGRRSRVLEAAERVCWRCGARGPGTVLIAPGPEPSRQRVSLVTAA